MPSIVIIGSGFGGLAAAIELKKAGHDDLVILEKASDVGGVWRDNTYPGAACDVPSALYSYSFEPHPGWTKRYSEQPGILEYAERVADGYDLRRHLRTGAEVTRIVWDERTTQWQVELADGDVVSADFVVPAVGQLSRPSLPSIRGAETFEGPAFHSATWDHSVDLTGLRVAVIGTGASAIQFVPAIQPDVAQLALFQRTPPYIAPRHDAVYGTKHHRVFERLPFVQRSERLGWWVYLETVTTSMLYSKLMGKVLLRYSKWHMKKQTSGVPGLFEKVWPNYPIGCKRILMSDNYLPALAQPNVDVVTAGIAEIRPAGVVTTDGVLHEADVIIYGTGFAASEFLAPMTIVGRGGVDLHELWSEGARAHWGVTVPDFPNFLIMYGPNTNTGGGSIPYFLETQARYVRDFVDAAVAQREPLEVRPDVADAFDRDTQRRLSGSVWTKCSSWYRNANGRISTNWPGVSAEYRRKAVFRREDHQAARTGVNA